jgi:outer membrane protein assembly factor BamE
MPRQFLLPLLVAVTLSSCISVYKTDTQQGNLVTQEMLDKIKPGMTRSQVRFALGTPFVVDSFHPDRWEYYFYFRKGKTGATETYRVTAYFDKDTLMRIDGAGKPADPVPATPTTNTAPTPAP